MLLLLCTAPTCTKRKMRRAGANIDQLAAELAPHAPQRGAPSELPFRFDARLIALGDVDLLGEMTGASTADADADDIGDCP